MACWQNPVIVVAQLMPQATTLHAISEVLHAIAWASMITFWLIMIDGLGYTPRELPRHFYSLKVAFASVFFCVTLALQLLKRASFYFPSVRPNFIEDNDTVRVSVLVMCAAFLALLLFWLVWFMRVAVRTGRRLKLEPYMQTRFRQLTFRFLLFQQTLVRGRHGGVHAPQPVSAWHGMARRVGPCGVVSSVPPSRCPHAGWGSLPCRASLARWSCL